MCNIIVISLHRLTSEGRQKATSTSIILAHLFLFRFKFETALTMDTALVWLGRRQMPMPPRTPPRWVAAKLSHHSFLHTQLPGLTQHPAWPADVALSQRALLADPAVWTGAAGPLVMNSHRGFRANPSWMQRSAGSR